MTSRVEAAAKVTPSTAATEDQNDPPHHFPLISCKVVSCGVQIKACFCEADTRVMVILRLKEVAVRRYHRGHFSSQNLKH